MDYLSVSRIQTYMYCPRKFYYRYIEGLEDTSPALERGRKFHQALQAFWRKEPIPESEEGQYVSAFIDEIKDYDIVETEKEFDIEIENLRVIGYIDALTSDNRILEIKTSSRKDAFPEISLQLTVYSLAVPAETCELLFFVLGKNPQLIRRQFNMKQFDPSHYIEIIKQVALSIELGLFYPRYQDYHCKSLCTFYPLCAEKNLLR